MQPTMFVIMHLKRTVLLLVSLLVTVSGSSQAAELKTHTIEAFNLYAHVTEDRISQQVASQGAFLCLDGVEQRQRSAIRGELRRGKAFIYQPGMCNAGYQIKAPDGLIHHWIAAMFVDGAALPDALAILQDYDNHQEIYKPDVQQSRLLSKRRNESQVYLRFYRNAIVTAAYNSEFDVRWVMISASRAYSRSHSTRIAEVANPGDLEERERPVGNDRGFLWRLYSCWRLEERDGGVYLELEVIALSRSVPAIISWFVNPLLKSIPKAYLSNCLNATRAELKRRTALTCPSGIVLSSHVYLCNADPGPGSLASSTRRTSEYPLPAVRQPPDVALRSGAREAGGDPMSIRIEVVDDGKIELFDSEDRRWSEYEHVSKAIAAVAKILRRGVEKQNREPAPELFGYQRRG